MIFITIGKKPVEIALIVLCCLMTAATLFLLFFSVTFGFGGGAANLFGQSVYIVRTDAFELIKSPGAVIAKKVGIDEISEKNIVIFEFDGHKAIGEILGKSVSDGGVAYFTVADENGDAHVVPEHSVIAKAMRYSAVLGVIADFAVSPAGVLVIAVTPCVCVLALEALRPIFRKKREKEEVTPVNKQDETPTFIPGASSAAALRAYKDAAGAPAGEKPQLFTAPKRPAYKLAPQKKKEPLSSEKLASAIAAVNARRGKTGEIDLPASGGDTRDIRRAGLNPAQKEATDGVRKYAPKAKDSGGENGIEEILAAYSKKKGERYED
ncbi:MAG: hypothetical protein LBI38_05395 [Oscillospiraceae bacterium]|jgi:hypothetical protein|nr:hypothetical protein [Oscillospiraceae bacterium]